MVVVFVVVVVVVFVVVVGSKVGSRVGSNLHLSPDPAEDQNSTDLRPRVGFQLPMARIPENNFDKP